MVDWCTEGNGVANDYCKKFAAVDPSVKVGSRALVKMTKSEMGEIQKAMGYGLSGTHAQDCFIYLVNAKGEGIGFSGLRGGLGGGSPYKVCTVHTQAAWEAYQQQQENNQQQQPDDGNGGGIIFH